MLKSNLLEGGSTNIRLSKSSHDILVTDCYRFGLLRKDEANISFIISKLIKELTIYRENLHDEFLKNNKSDIHVVKSIENNIFNIYLKTFNYICDDSHINVGYRINKEFKQSIENLFYETLEKFDMDFTSYVRSIIYEYCSRSELQRELFLNYELVCQIRKCINKSCVTTIINDDVQNDMVLVSIEAVDNGYNYLLGISVDKKECYFLPLCKTKKIMMRKQIVEVSEDELDKITQHFKDFIEENK